MAPLSAFRLIVLAGLKNRVVAQLRRIRQPRYLVATLLGLAYWWWYAGRFLGGVGRGRGLPEDWSLPLELGLTALALLLVALGWLLGSDRGALTFTEAEIQFLFPAPLSRRQLVHYKLLRLLVTGLVGAAITAFFLGRSLGGSPVVFALGSWVGLTTLSFHNLAASFTRAGLARHGLSGLRRFLLTLLVAGALLAGLWLAARRVAPPALSGHAAEDLLAWAAALDGSALGWALWPVRAPIRLAMARSAWDVAVALPAALSLLGLHYAWVMATVTHFEDGALREAERRARLPEVARSKGVGAVVHAVGRRRVPFRLAPRGRPEVALLWKGLIASARTPGLRVFLGMGLALCVVTLVALVRRAGGSLELVGLTSASLFAVAVLVGPGLLRTDLRLDLANLEVLRTLPLDGTRLLRGELAAPLLVLTAVQWAALPLAALGLPGDVGAGLRLALALSAALLGPALSLVALTLQNGFVILLPAWIPTGPERARGPEALGLRLITALGHLLALGVALLPAALLGGVALLGAWTVFGAAGLPIAAAVATAALAGEAWLATAVLGRLLDRLDPSGL